jgi:hypothetical protein
MHGFPSFKLPSAPKLLEVSIRMDFELRAQRVLNKMESEVNLEK